MHKTLRHALLIIVALFLSLPASTAWAQKQKVKNLPYYDTRLLHWGFSLGLNMPDITFTHSLCEAGEGWMAATTEFSPAFQVGLMGDLAITQHLNFRVSPTLYFQQRNVTFGRTAADAGWQEVVQQLKTTYIEIPASLKVSTRRINNYRPYLVTGMQIDVDMAHEKETPIVFERLDLGVHIGMGCDLYLPFFKLAPELRFNLGLLDMIDHERQGLQDETMRPFTDAIHSARNRSISLIFWFE